MMTGTGHMGDRVRVATGNGAGAPPHCRRRARVQCARRVALEHHLSVPAPCIPRAAPRTLINLAASERSTQDARCLGLAGFDPEARARAAQPKRGRQPARPTRLARGVAAAISPRPGTLHPASSAALQWVA